jgi:hypothetical protein
MTPFWRSRYFVVGALMVVLGTGPLFVVIAMADLGLSADPNPNPIGFGILALFTFWPGIILMALGIVTSLRGRKRENRGT